MHDDVRVEPGHDDLQTLDNVLADTPTTPRTRAWLLKRAGLGVAAAGAATTFGPVSSALAALESRTADSVGTVVTTAVTAEALAVTFLDQVIKKAPGTPSAKHPLIDVLRAAGAAEYDHLQALRKLGGKPLTTNFWIPDAAFGNGGVALFQVIEKLETLFIDAYLIGITVFGRAKQPAYARYGAEILGTEAEHRVLARFAQGSIVGNFAHVPNNKGFETYQLHTMAQVVAQLEKLGIGLGKQSSAAGNFYALPTGKPGTFSAIDSNFPS